MSTFPIKIDATNLVYRMFGIPEQRTGWIDSRVVQTLMLKPRTYSFQIASGRNADFQFTVTDEGKVEYPAGLDVTPPAGQTGQKGFLSGRGTSTLKIVGLKVTLDARYLAGAGVLLVIPRSQWFTYKTCQMVPDSYAVQQSPGMVSPFLFRLKPDGTFSYEEKYDISRNGFLAGQGTSTLQFLGYPLLVDARASGGKGVGIRPPGTPVTPTSVQFANLLPAPGFSLQINSGTSTTPQFGLDVSGKFSFDSSSAQYFRLETFHGLTTLKVIAPLP
ncbi:MAG TPA: hypothetical protein VF658_14165 [Pyrinomonadaceae bacterium]|jgi:hypothetical protein